jgi:hypothetical protein
MNVVIDPGPPIKVTPDPAEVVKDNGSEVVWQHKTGDAFTIEFEGKGPFQSRNFDHKGPRSGKVRSEVPKSSEHKYTVTVGGKKLDPLVIVR